METKIKSQKQEEEPKRLSKIGEYLKRVQGQKTGEIYDMRAVLR